MTVRREEKELTKAALVKAIRSFVRLKHSLAADAELNEVLPAAEKLFDDAWQNGTALEPGEVLKELGVGP